MKIIGVNNANRFIRGNQTLISIDFAYEYFENFNCIYKFFYKSFGIFTFSHQIDNFDLSMKAYALILFCCKIADKFSFNKKDVQYPLIN